MRACTKGSQTVSSRQYRQRKGLELIVELLSASGLQPRTREAVPGMEGLDVAIGCYCTPESACADQANGRPPPRRRLNSDGRDIVLGRDGEPLDIGAHCVDAEPASFKHWAGRLDSDEAIDERCEADRKVARACAKLENMTRVWPEQRLNNGESLRRIWRPMPAEVWRNSMARRRGLLDHLVRPKQHRLWDRQPERPCSSEIDDQLELRRLLDGEVGRFGTLEDLVYIDGASMNATA